MMIFNRSTLSFVSVLVLSSAALGYGVVTLRLFAGAPEVHARDVEWSELIPMSDVERQGEKVVPTGIVEHGAYVNLPKNYGGLGKFSTHLDGSYVRLTGYVVPIGYRGEALSEFLLVPYVGACPHVPRPPLNQIVQVRTDVGVAPVGRYEAIDVIGQMTAKATAEKPSDVGYSVVASLVKIHNNDVRVPKPGPDSWGIRYRYRYDAVSHASDRSHDFWNHSARAGPK